MSLSRKTEFSQNKFNRAISSPKLPRSQTPDASQKLFQIRFSPVIMEALCSSVIVRDLVPTHSGKDEDDYDDDET